MLFGRSKWLQESSTEHAKPKTEADNKQLNDCGLGRDGKSKLSVKETSKSKLDLPVDGDVSQAKGKKAKTSSNSSNSELLSSASTGSHKKEKKEKTNHTKDKTKSKTKK